MPSSKVISAYKGQLTSVKNVIARYIRLEEGQPSEINQTELARDGARMHLETQMEICDRIRTRYCRAQEAVIMNAEDENARELETKELDAFLEEIDRAEEKLNEIILAIKVNESAKNNIFHSTVIEDERVDVLLKGFTNLIERLDGQKNTGFAKLEPIKIPPFSGVYTEWPAFKDLFLSLVDKNKHYSKTQKMSHLKTSLTGQAKGVIDHLSVCDDNYDIAWKAIVERYESKKTVVKEYIERVKSLPSLKTPHADELRKIYDVTTTSICALDALKVSQRDPWIIHEVVSKLDAETQTLWAREQDELPTWDEFKVFLDKRCKALEMCPSTFVSSSNNDKNSNSKIVNQKLKAKPVKSLTISNDQCTICKKAGHKLWKCGKFKSLPSAKRLEIVNSLKLCVNCLSENKSQHTVENCPYPPCKHCNKSHNYWVHDALTQVPSDKVDPPTPVPEDKPAVLGSFVSAKASGEEYRAILKTACVKILDSQSNVHTCRALLDFGSEISVMTTDLCQRLRLRMQKSPYGQVEGFQGQVSTIRHQVTASLVPSVGSHVHVQFQVTPKISSNLPTCRIKAGEIQFPNSYVLADANWYESRPIDLLIGAAHEDEVMLNEVCNLGEGIPSLRKSIFGWVVGGKWKPGIPRSTATPAVCHKISLKTIDETLEKFWTLEELSEEKPQLVEHREVEALYECTTKRSVTGQYIVRLPLKGNFGELGSNRHRASRQLNFLEKRLSKTPQLYQEYSNIFEEYLSLGIIERVPLPELKAKSYYMTHHCVVRENASSTKVRIVFNCGSVSESGISLNDVIKVGPVVQPELIEILWRFRRHEIALSCDVVKMYLQVQLAEEHRDLQRFIWRKSPKDPLTDYRFKTLCFGNAASPYLATKTLVRLADDEGHQFPLAAEVIRNNFYVDDCLLSVATVEEAVEVQLQLIELLKKAQMKLAKWQSNSTDVLKAVQAETPSTVPLSDSFVKALGVAWDPRGDIFLFHVDASVWDLIPTKRNVLSVIARIYDPLGLLAPITINAKLLLQKLWKENLDWDTPFTGELLQDWTTFLSTMSHIPSLTIRRWTSTLSNIVEEQLHMFSDASNVAYGAVIYHVTKDAEGRVSSHMLTAKSKVAPVKTKTIPKLELCGATLGAKLLAKVSKTLHITNLYCWVDAKVVLAQIASASNKQDVFTKNRVATIRELTPVECWNHVPTQENPADLISRGTTAMELKSSSLYFIGPDWLSHGESYWPNAVEDLPAVEEAEDTVAALNITNQPENHIFTTFMNTFSKVSRMKGALLCIMKYLHILRFRVLRKKGHQGPPPHVSLIHTPQEWKWAETQLIKWDQALHLSDVIRNLTDKKPIERGEFRKLHPFMDAEGILRIGGRLGHLDDDYNTKYPKILPRSGLTRLILAEMHVMLMHAPPQLLLAHVRRKYWPIGGRHVTRSIVHHCKACFVLKTARENQLMADLPKHRISLIKAFTSVSIDCCGPFHIRTGAEARGRSQRVDIVVFVCTATKAIHLEIVSSLSSDAFLSSFRRFTSRRGVPKDVYSDNGRNFVGAARELQRLIANQAQAIQDQTRILNTTWHFQPPRSPHFNGLVEAAVKSAKTHLKKVIGDQRLNFEEFYTVLTQVEAVLNSRPLTTLSDDPRDPQPLTPGHFLMLAPPTQLPDEDLTSVRISHTHRWQLVQRILQDFVRKWKLSYLHTLQERVKWQTEKENIKVDDIVILHDASIGRTQWTTGRVVNIHTGADGRVRVIDVKTPFGIYTRAITNVAKLPMCESHTSPREHVGNLIN